MVHSLAQTLLKLVSPGVADIYQGCELWDFNLVDPDNRRPVDYEHRSRRLHQIRDDLASGQPRAEVARRLFANPEDGAIKLYLIWTVLNHRKADQALYMQGAYRSLDVQGDLRGNVIALLRRREGRTMIAVAPRLVAGLMGDDATRAPLGRDVWHETQCVLPDLAAASRWCNLLTDQTIDVKTVSDQRVLDLDEIFQDVPVALLVEETPMTG